ncbi:MAG TPA: hypothetical protein VJQ85_00665 [Gaiellaceae bacterium]|nr:hypothetical protein [Gaiellaceae bacterium]
MAAETEIRKEIAGEREQLTDAVKSLREELSTAGKKAGAAVGALVAAKVVLKIVRRATRR